MSMVLRTTMVPPVRKTQILAAVASAHARKLPGPASCRFVTSMTLPPRPPDVVEPKPSARGKAGNATERVALAGLDSTTTPGTPTRNTPTKIATAVSRM